jgi:hypothetical protein
MDNTKIYRCACKTPGLMHTWTTDNSGKWALIVDPRHARFLRDVAYNVSRMHPRSKLVRARATSTAPGIKRGRQLHQLVMRVGNGRRVWALNRNYLDARRGNLKSMSFADTRILSSARPSTHAIGVSRPAHQARRRCSARSCEVA